LQGTGFHPDVNLCTTTPSIDPDISITQIIQIHFWYISTSGFSKPTQIQAHTSYCWVTLLLIDNGQHMSKFSFSQRNLVSRLHVVLRSVRNLHHRKDLLLARRFGYKLDMFWIRGFGLIGCQSPKILTPDLAETRDIRHPSPKPVQKI